MTSTRQFGIPRRLGYLNAATLGVATEAYEGALGTKEQEVIARVYYYSFLLRALVYLLPLLAFGAAAYIRFGHVWLHGVNTVNPEHYVILLAFTELVWIVAAKYCKASSIMVLFCGYAGIRAAFLACFVTLLLQTALLVFATQLVISRLFILLSNAILFFAAVATINLFRLTSASSAWPRKYERIVVVGTDHYARRIVKLLQRIPFLDCEVQAYLQLPGQPVLVRNAPVIRSTEPMHLEGLSFDDVVIAIPPKRYFQVSSLIEGLQHLGRPVRAILDLGPRLSVREQSFQVGRLQVMNLANSRIESFAYTVLKRTFDLVFAILGMVILSPVFLTIALLVKLSSPSDPILFRQERVGRYGKHFTLLKFRTMRSSTTAESDTTWTTRDDPRRTGVGAILRKFCLDELPQLFNVIRGDMSLVGPRPERPYFVAKFRNKVQKYILRHSCQVGMTGWAQVNGLRGNTSISDRLRYDLYYIQNWSFGLDIRIIARTLITALRDENGY